MTESFKCDTPGEMHECDQCRLTITDERCPKCKLWVCSDCFDSDHIFCEGPDDFNLGQLRERAIEHSIRINMFNTATAIAAMRGA